MPIVWLDSPPADLRRLIDFYKIEIPGPVPVNIIVMVEEDDTGEQSADPERGSPHSPEEEP